MTLPKLWSNMSTRLSLKLPSDRYKPLKSRSNQLYCAGGKNGYLREFLKSFGEILIKEKDDVKKFLIFYLINIITYNKQEEHKTTWKTNKFLTFKGPRKKYLPIIKTLFLYHVSSR
jgi:hypothetical protein